MQPQSYGSSAYEKEPLDFTKVLTEALNESSISSMLLLTITIPHLATVHT
jgi:hypothetical protein